jgi:hypothetical protein
MTTGAWRGRDIAVHIKEAVPAHGPVHDGPGSQRTTRRLSHPHSEVHRPRLCTDVDAREGGWRGGPIVPARHPTVPQFDSANRL